MLKVRRNHLVLAVGLMSLFLSCCSSTFTEEQRATLSTIRLDQTTKEANAYSDPHGAVPGAAENWTVASGGGLVGALIGAGIESSQNSMFVKKDGEHFDKLKDLTPSALETVLDTEIQGAVEGNSFFASRVRSESPNRVVSEITAYSLSRTGKNDEKYLLMSPFITADIRIVGADEKKIGGRILPITGRSSLSLPITSYIADPRLLEKGYNEAAHNIGEALAQILATKTAE